VDSPRSSGVRVAIKRRSFSSSFVQVLGLAPCSEGASTANSVIRPNDGDGNEHVPH
jgi:hypothetical protein